MQVSSFCSFSLLKSESLLYSLAQFEALLQAVNRYVSFIVVSLYLQQNQCFKMCLFLKYPVNCRTGVNPCNSIGLVKIILFRSQSRLYGRNNRKVGRLSEDGINLTDRIAPLIRMKFKRMNATRKSKRNNTRKQAPYP